MNHCASQGERQGWKARCLVTHATASLSRSYRADDDMTSTTETAMPDAGTDPETMTIEEISRGLAGYKPGTQAEVVEIRAYMAQRARLWRRLDALKGIRRLAAAAPAQRGAQAS
jgi:hypothetical protein